MVLQNDSFPPVSLDNLLPHRVVYKTGENGYSYKTDESGRISNASTKELQSKTHEDRLPHNPKTPGKLAGDHAGHLFGDRFGGSPELDNLVSQTSKVNLSEYKKIENIWAKAIKDEKKVAVDIKINYPSGGSRPSSFEIEYTIDGIPSYEKIYN